MNNQNVKLISRGIKCDNPKCDWIDDTVPFDNLKDWLNKPCPKCGENVLTDEDFKNAEIVSLSMKLINALTPEQLASIISNTDTEEIKQQLKQNPISKDAKGIDDLKDGNVGMIIETHKGIKITELKNLNTDAKA